MVHLMAQDGSAKVQVSHDAAPITCCLDWIAQPTQRSASRTNSGISGTSTPEARQLGIAIRFVFLSPEVRVGILVATLLKLCLMPFLVRFFDRCPMCLNASLPRSSPNAASKSSRTIP